MLKKNLLKHYEGKSIVITGGNGYIGQSLVKQLISVQCKITILEKKPSHDVSLKNSVLFISGDVSQEKTWKEIIKKADIIFHLAAQTSSKHSNEKPFDDYEINIAPILHFLKITNLLGKFPDIIFSGSVTQAGLTPKQKIDETFYDAPLSIYDIHKSAVEKFLLYYATWFGKAAILRLANVYGPGAQSRQNDRGIVNRMVQNALQGEPITIYGTGKFMRDYIYIDDVVDALLLSAIHIHKISGNYYLICSGNPTMLYTMVQIIRNEVLKKTGKEINIRFIDFPAGTSAIEKRSFIGNSGKYSSLTGWKPSVGVGEGILSTINFFYNQAKV